MYMARLRKIENHLRLKNEKTTAAGFPAAVVAVFCFIFISIVPA